MLVTSLANSSLTGEIANGITSVLEPGMLNMVLTAIIRQCASKRPLS